MRFLLYKWPPHAPEAIKMPLQGILVEFIMTSGLVAIFYFFSISLTFYNKWTLSVSGVQTMHTVNMSCSLLLPGITTLYPSSPTTVRLGI